MLQTILKNILENDEENDGSNNASSDAQETDSGNLVDSGLNFDNVWQVFQNLPVLATLLHLKV